MQLVTPEQIAAVMALMPAPHSFAELDEQVAGGLPKAALKAGVARIGRNADERREILYRVVPEATLKRRQDRLSAAESEKTERLARVYATARHVWDSDDDALAFVHTPHAMLGGRAPLDVGMTELGARRVEALLWRLFYGIAA
ncbi:antitoxin Xre/MbcA/ParS toxin-binding domain-containing protein [Candidatus Accumulibacter sp. ACC003]|uniref:antitoxin Xre/MbcA/ParS toxin-binding domain-containing protein n=1 Tax=Candidatus Accumulibacter sp. ACC003 TaxID=2823334 RepID=UPI0025BC5F14|nr:antitoxin Xre/MbcA/ParS toxin-binding domain-containing protein [Candidatus Accumulibacter sp. ACC003]